MTMTGTIVRGDDIEIIQNVVDSAGVAVNLTGITAAIFKLKETLSGSTVLTKSLGSGVTVTNAVTGELTIVITNANSSLLNAKLHYFEIEIADATSRKSTVRNSDGSPGELTVIEDF